MADKTENIKTRLSFDGEAEYKAACKGINSTLKVLNSEMKLVTAEYKDNANSTEALKAKQNVLKKTYDEQAKKVKETEEALEKCKKVTGDNSEESKKLETQLNYQKAALVKTGQELDKTTDGMGKAGKASKEMGKGVDESGKSAEEASEKFSGLRGVLETIGSAMLKGVAAVGAGALAIGAAAGTGIAYAAKQVDGAKGALNNFVTATGTATSEADKYKQVMENIYNGNYGEGFEDIAAAMAEVKQQAGDLGAGELEKMTTNAIILRDTFDMDVAESTRAATQLMQQFGLESDEAYNLIAQGAQNGLNQNGDLLDVINEYSNQYSSAGLSAEDMFNSIQNGADTGVWSIDKMGDAFKEFNIRMSDGTAGEYLTSLGLNADEVVGKFQSGGESAKEAMSQIGTALKECDDESLQYTTGVGLMGTMWEDMGAGACTSMMEVDGQISKTIDAMDEINAVKYDTFAQAMEGTGRILQTSLIMPIGEQVLPIFNQFANELQTGAAEAGGDVGKMAESFGTALNNMVNGITEIIPQIAEFAIQIITGLAEGLVEALPALTDSSLNIVMTLINGIVELIPTLAEGAISIITGLAQGLGEALPQLIPSIIETMLTIVETLIQNMPLLINAALQLITGLAEGLVQALPMLAERLPEIIVAIINGLVEALPTIIESAGQIIVALVTGLVNAIPILIENLPQIVIAIVTGLAEAIPKVAVVMWDVIQSVWDVLKNMPGKIWDAIVGAVVKMLEWGLSMQEKAREAVNTLMSNVVTSLTELPGKIWDAIVGAVVKIAEWGMSMKDKAGEAISSVCSAVQEGFLNLPEKVKDIGKNLVQGLWNGINNAKDWVLDKIKGFGDAILKGLKSFFGIHSPSTLMEDEVGKFLAQGVGVGFTNEMETVGKNIAESIPSEFDVAGKVKVSAENDTSIGANKSDSGIAGGITVVQNIYANETSYAKQQKEAAKQFKLIARTV